MIALGLGLAITMLLKYINYSTNPLWATTDASSGGWNKTGLLLAAIGLAEYALRPASLFPAPPPVEEEKDKPVVLETNRGQRAALMLGFGSIIHMLQTFNMDAGTIISWTWTGWPLTGPVLNPSAGLVIATAAFGAINYPPVPIWPVGLLGAFVLYRYPDWMGFYGGIAVVGFLASTFPKIVRAASALSPARTFGRAHLVNIVLDIASVVTAAYAFVPLGWLLRERTDLILGFCMLSIAWAEMVSMSIRLPESVFARSLARIQLFRSLNLVAVTIVVVIGFARSYAKMQVVPAPYFPEHRIFSGGIWTVSPPFSSSSS